MKKNNYKSKFIFLVFVFIFTALWLINSQEYSKDSILCHYGFFDKEQRSSIHTLCKLAFIEEDLLAHKKTQEQIIESSVDFIEETQKKFFMRKNNKERWEIEKADWIQKNEIIVCNNLSTLGFVKAIMPKISQPDAICILGSTKESMECRIRFVEFLMKNNKIKSDMIIFLVGERNVTVNIDGSIDELLLIAKKFDIKDYNKLTETHLAMYLYENSCLQNIKTIFIDVPFKNNQRPTTQTTIVELIGWLKKHKNIKNIVFISGQPHGKYQSAIISAIFDDRCANVNFEVVGNAAKKTSSAQSFLEGLGSYIWACSPQVFKKMNVKNVDKSIKERLQNLYSKQKIMYQCLPNSFK